MTIDLEDQDTFGNAVADRHEYTDEELCLFDLRSRESALPPVQWPDGEDTQEQYEDSSTASLYGTPAGSGDYVVQEGDCLSQIAFDNGFSPQTLWLDPRNSELRRARKNPHVLLAGDRVHIPRRRPCVEGCGTNVRHRFRRKGVPEFVNLKFIDCEDQPLARVECRITVDGIHRSTKTGADGGLKIPIPPNARDVRLVFECTGEEIQVGLGELDPVDTLQGACQRLRNLGFENGEFSAGATGQVREAVRAFQYKYDLPETAEIDTATQDKLQEIHGS